MSALMVFGDSWAWGSELGPDEMPFGQLLAMRMGSAYKNFSECSTSIPHLILQFRDAVEYLGDELPGTLCLFFLSSPHRDLLWDSSKEPKELHINPSHPDDTDVLWYSKIHTNELATYRINTTLLALMNLCAQHKVIDRYVWGWETIELWPEIPRDRFYDLGRSTVLDMFDDIPDAQDINDYASRKNNLYIYPNSGHPNQLGHRLIAEKLHDWIAPCMSDLK